MPTKDLCLNCKHYWGALACAAFPDRIPDEILTGDNDHAERYPSQSGAFVFEEIDFSAMTVGGDFALRLRNQRQPAAPPQK